MTDRSLAQYGDLLRNDFVAFAHRAFMELDQSEPFEPNWHIEVIAEKLEAVRHGRCNRLIINVPPRSLKSYLGSIAFPTFMLGHNPAMEVLCVSYGQAFANGMSRSCRTLMSSPFYRSIFPTRLSADRQATEEFETTAGGVRRAVSPDGPVTGRGADLIIIDDLVKANEAETEPQRAATNFSYDSVISTRMNRDSVAIVLIMQRLHANDFTAFVQKNDEWDVVTLPALAIEDEVYRIKTPYGRRTVTRPVGEALQPLRFSANFLLKKQAGNPRLFAAQYQQRPHTAGSALFQRDWLRDYDKHTRPPVFDQILQSWDTASRPGESNSYNVCTTWGIRDRHYYLLDCFRDRLDYRKLQARAEALAREHEATVIVVEAESLGTPLAQYLSDKGFNAQAVPSTNASKESRLFAQINKFSDGYVHLPREASWLEEYVLELTTFPDSEYSDQVDSTSQALAHDIANTSFDNAIEAMNLLAGKSPESSEMWRVKPPPGQEISVLEIVEDRDCYTVTPYTPDGDGVFLLPKKWAQHWISKGWIRLD